MNSKYLTSSIFGLAAMSLAGCGGSAGGNSIQQLSQLYSNFSFVYPTDGATNVCTSPVIKIFFDARSPGPNGQTVIGSVCQSSGFPNDLVHLYDPISGDQYNLKVSSFNAGIDQGTCVREFTIDQNNNDDAHKFLEQNTNYHLAILQSPDGSLLTNPETISFKTGTASSSCTSNFAVNDNQGYSSNFPEIEYTAENGILNPDWEATFDLENFENFATDLITQVLGGILGGSNTLGTSETVVTNKNVLTSSITSDSVKIFKLPVKCNAYLFGICIVPVADAGATELFSEDGISYNAGVDGSNPKAIKFSNIDADPDYYYVVVITKAVRDNSGFNLVSSYYKIFLNN